MDSHVPPLLLTFQQLFLASTLLQFRLATCTSNGAQPMPVFRLKGMGRRLDVDKSPIGDVEQAPVDVVDRSMASSTERMPSTSEETDDDNAAPLDFYLAGLFNCMDFLASNTAFSASAASFVETVKASDPMTTTAIALAYGVDRLGASEAFGLGLLVSGILLSTWGSGANDIHHRYHRALRDGIQDSVNLDSSLHSAMLVVVANLSFAFRAMTQKLYQRHSKIPLNDESLLCRLQQIGWITLLLPVLILYAGKLKESILVENNKSEYVKLSLLNASAYATYK
jgi:drug/metabolite transporter (DMT)-like permease